MAQITDQQIADAAAGPVEVTADGIDVTARPIDELLKAQQSLAASAALASGVNPWQMSMMARFVPPGGS